MLYHNQAAAQPPGQIYGLEGESVVEWTDFLSTLRQDSSNVALTSAAALRRKCSRRKEEREISIKTSLQDMIVTSTKYTKTSMMRIRLLSLGKPSGERKNPESHFILFIQIIVEELREEI